MALILNIDSATTVCSASLSKKGELIDLREEDGNFMHAEKLGVFILELIERNAYHFKDIDAIAVSKGPGSYTGLRIGVSLAKGLCYGMSKPLISVETLKSMTNGAIKKQFDKDAYYLPMIDARRMEVYSAIYNVNMEAIRETEATIIDKTSFHEFTLDKNIYYFGNGASKCTITFHDNPNMQFLDGINTSSAYMAELSYLKFQKNQFEDIAYFEPYYLKDFIAGKKKKNQTIEKNYE